MVGGTAQRHGRMTRIWRYVLANDNGMAPCSEDGILTLACRKPGIRKSAQRGDWVIGFLPKSMPGRIAWVGQVADVLPLGEYEQKYTGRRDAIYRLNGHAADGAEILHPLRDDYHVDRRQTDFRGKNALVFSRFWYWGGNGVGAPNDIRDWAHYHVGQSAKNSSPEKLARLEAWVRSMAEPGVHGATRDMARKSMPTTLAMKRLGV
jgi:hypothetical protein